MSEFKVSRTNGRSGVPDEPNNKEIQAAIGRRRQLLTMPEMQEQVLNGNVFIAFVGKSTTPVSFAKTTYDLNQPQFVIDVPAGISIMPLNLEIVAEAAAGVINEYIWSQSNVVIGAGTSTLHVFDTDLFNYKTAADGVEHESACTVRSLYTGDGANPTDSFEFARWSDAFAQEAGSVDGKHFRWNYLTNGPAPWIEGTGALVCHIVGGTAPSGYLTATWLEVNS